VSLFSAYNEHEARNKRCFSDLNHMSSVQQKHANSQTHAQCYLQLKLFCIYWTVCKYLYCYIKHSCRHVILDRYTRRQKKPKRTAIGERGGHNTFVIALSPLPPFTQNL
jgi:hypothetical protein